MRPLFLALVLTSAAASAQPEWRAVHVDGPAVTLDLLTAVGDDFGFVLTDETGFEIGDAETGVLNVTFVVGGRVPVGGRLVVVGELPLSAARVEIPTAGGGSQSESDVTVGNPYLGAEVALGPGVAVGGGVRLPLFQYEENGFVAPGRFGWQGGLTADPERFEAYMPGVLSVSAEARLAERVGPALVRVRVSPSYLAEVSDVGLAGDPDRTGVALGYSALADLGVRGATVTGGVVGRPVLAGEWFDQFSVGATAVAGVSGPVGPVRPGLSVRLPLATNDSFYRPDATVGVSLDVPIR